MPPIDFGFGERDSGGGSAPLPVFLHRHSGSTRKDLCFFLASILVHFLTLFPGTRRIETVRALRLLRGVLLLILLALLVLLVLILLLILVLLLLLVVALLLVLTKEDRESLLERRDISLYGSFCIRAEVALESFY